MAAADDPIHMGLPDRWSPPHRAGMPVRTEDGVSAYDMAARSRHLVDLEDGLTSRWDRDLSRVDQTADDSAFAVITNT